MRALLVATCLVLAATPAFAEPTAKELFEDGMKHFNVADYTEAITQWKKGYLLSKKPLFLFNIAQAYRFSGDCVQAMTFYESYAREEQNIKNQDELDAGIAACKNAKPPEKKPEQVTTTTQAPPPPDKTPPVQTPPPPKPVEKPIAPAPEAAEASGGGLRKIGMVTAGVGVVAGAIGAYYARQSAKWSDKLNGWNMPWTSEQNAWQSSGKIAATRAWVFGGGGVVLAVAGVAMYALGGPKEQSVAIAPTRGGAAVAWGFNF